MPTCEYPCEACKHTSSAIQTLPEGEKEKPVCPKCNEKDVKQLISASRARSAGKVRGRCHRFAQIPGNYTRGYLL